MKIPISLYLLTFVILAGVCANAAPVYTQNPNLSDFTSTVSIYGAFTNGINSPYTPTTAILSAVDYPRVIGSSTLPIVIQFAAAQSDILVFNNIDHTGQDWDAYQYDIYGSNVGGANIAGDYTLLFDPTGVAGPSPNFTLTSWTGTAPTSVNNTVTPGLGSYNGSIGYEEYFSFSIGYQYFALLPSTFDLTAFGGENEVELSAVGVALPDSSVPEPATCTLFGAGLGAMAFLRRRFSTLSQS